MKRVFIFLFCFIACSAFSQTKKREDEASKDTISGKLGVIKVQTKGKKIDLPDSVQTIPSDTFSLYGATFRIVLPKRYYSSIYPTVLNYQIVLVNKDRNRVKDFILQYTFTEFGLISASSSIANAIGIYKTDNTVTKNFPLHNVVWISEIVGVDANGVKRKPLINSFKVERIK